MYGMINSPDLPSEWLPEIILCSVFSAYKKGVFKFGQASNLVKKFEDDEVKDKFMKCNKAGCPNDTKYQIVILVYAPKDYGSQPAAGLMGLFVCEEHKETTKIEDVIDDNGWKQIEQSFIQAGKHPPERKLTKLQFREI